MKNITLLLIISQLITFNIFAQKNFSEGYIITKNHDTIHGKVKDKFFMPSTSKISFIDSTGVEKDYKASEILGYSKADIANYLSVDLGLIKGISYDFARIKVNGYICLLTYKRKNVNVNNNNNQNGFTFGQVGTGSSNEVEVFYLYNSDTKQVKEVYQIGFKDSMSKYFEDYVKLKESILNKELRYDDLEIIVEKYNRWKKNGE